ncbi:Inner membrane protein YccS [Halioglobus japonicus]|nr:Inner membrane protein YccS [Halioglobus japonicus]
MSTTEAGAWYHKLALLKPAPYRPWRHSLRIAVGTGLPLLIGVLGGDVRATIFVALGAFLTAMTVRLDPYRERILQIAISTSVGVLGCFIGPAVADQGLMTVCMLALVGLCSGLISGYGAAFSTGALNMLVFAIVTSSLSHAVSPWWLGLQYLLGALFVVLMLVVAAVLDRDRPERYMLAGLFGALAELARAAATVPASPSSENRAALEDRRRIVMDSSKAAYDVLIEKRSHGRAPTRHSRQAAAILSLVNQLTMSIIAARASSANLLVSANRLDEIANAYRQRGAPPSKALAIDEQQSELLRNVDRLANEIWAPSERAAENTRAITVTAKPVFLRNPLISLARKLIIGREVINSALRLSLCMGIAVWVSQLLAANHAYWLPMTVAIVLKPDFGSVFMRGIHRSIGTMIGVGVAALIAALVHNGLWIVAIIAVLCAFIPWAGLRSYAATVAFLTPVILLMISLVFPGSAENYALQRLIDTLLGAAIALVFGYLIWPQSRGVQINAEFSSVMEAVGGFLRAATKSVPQDEAALVSFRQSLADSEFTAYRGLSDLRTQLQRLLAEPPPAGREAASWFPAVASAERLCDRITAYAEGRRLGDPPPDEARRAKALASIAWLERWPHGDAIAKSAVDSPQLADLFAEVEAELAWLCDYRNQLATTVHSASAQEAVG